MKRLLAVLIAAAAMVVAPASPAQASFVKCEVILTHDPRITLANGSVVCVTPGFTSVNWTYPKGIRMGQNRFLSVRWYASCSEYSCGTLYQKNVYFPGDFGSASLASFYYVISVSIGLSD